MNGYIWDRLAYTYLNSPDQLCCCSTEFPHSEHWPRLGFCDSMWDCGRKGERQKEKTVKKRKKKTKINGKKWRKCLSCSNFTFTFQSSCLQPHPSLHQCHDPHVSQRLRSPRFAIASIPYLSKIPFMATFFYKRPKLVSVFIMKRNPRGLRF